MKKSLAVIFAVSTFLSSTTAFASYTDVKGVGKYDEAIDFITQEKVVSGYDDGTYKPEKFLNRAEFAKILTKAFTNGDDEIYAANCFKDVAGDAWYSKYVCFLKANQYVKGYEDNTFRPDQEITMPEALKIMLEIFKVDYDKNATPWYKDIVDVASKGNFIPLDFMSFDQHVTRGQMADMTTRYMKFIKGAAGKADPADNDLSFLNDYLGFLKDYKVTYDSLVNNENIEDKARDFDKNYSKNKAMQFEMIQDIAGNNLQTALFSADATENTDISCAKDYFYGNFSLALLGPKNYSRDRVLSKIDLGEKTVFPMGAIHYVNMSYEGANAQPWLVLEEYGDCNGNLFTFYTPDYIYGNLKPATFSGQTDNKIYAQSFKDISFDLYAFTYKYYDNSKAKYFTKSYFYDWNKKEFIEGNGNPISK